LVVRGRLERELAAPELVVVRAAAPELVALELAAVRAAAPESVALELVVVRAAAPESVALELVVALAAVPESVALELVAVRAAAPESAALEPAAARAAALAQQLALEPFPADLAPAPAECSAAAMSPELPSRTRPQFPNLKKPIYKAFCDCLCNSVRHSKQKRLSKIQKCGSSACPRCLPTRRSRCARRSPA
jgi:hypothetical protein